MSNTTIVSLTAENVKRLKAIKVTAGGAVVTVGSAVEETSEVKEAA